MNKPVTIDDYRKGTIYIDSQIDKLRLSKGSLIVEGDSNYSIPINLIGSLIIRGETSLTTNIIGELLDNGVCISLLGFYGNYRHTLHSDISGNVKLRHSQILVYNSNKYTIADI